MKMAFNLLIQIMKLYIPGSSSRSRPTNSILVDKEEDFKDNDIDLEDEDGKIRRSADERGDGGAGLADLNLDSESGRDCQC